MHPNLNAAGIRRDPVLRPGHRRWGHGTPPTSPARGPTRRCGASTGARCIPWRYIPGNPVDARAHRTRVATVTRPGGFPQTGTFRSEGLYSRRSCAGTQEDDDACGNPIASSGGPPRRRDIRLRVAAAARGGRRGSDGRLLRHPRRTGRRRCRSGGGSRGRTTPRGGPARGVAGRPVGVRRLRDERRATRRLAAGGALRRGGHRGARRADRVRARRGGDAGRQ